MREKRESKKRKKERAEEEDDTTGQKIATNEAKGRSRPKDWTGSCGDLLDLINQQEGRRG